MPCLGGRANSCAWDPYSNAAGIVGRPRDGYLLSGERQHATRCAQEVRRQERQELPGPTRSAARQYTVPPMLAILRVLLRPLADQAVLFLRRRAAGAARRAESRADSFRGVD
jgi:hypothetical protein